MHSEQPVKRICSQCGFKDHSAIPPIACPRCHFQPDNPVTEGLKNARPMNRRERRTDAAKNRQLVRQTQRKLLRVEKLGRAASTALQPEPDPVSEPVGDPVVEFNPEDHGRVRWITDEETSDGK